MNIHLRCQEFVELVTAYLEDALAPAIRAAFETHLHLCPGCQVYLDQIRETIRLLGHLPEAPLSPARRADLLRRFRAPSG